MKPGSRILALAFTRFAAVLVLLGAVCNSEAVTVSLQAAADTTIFSSYPDNDFGASTLESGANGVGAPGRSLFKFDLGSIPANATITSAALSMTLMKVPPGDQHAGAVDSDFGLYRMLVGWKEGTAAGQSGSSAQPGDSTWNERGADGVAAWGTPGGQSDTDYSSTLSTSTSVGTQLGLYDWGSTGQFVSDVQFWLEDPSANFGFIMISDQENTAGTARRFASKENPGGGVAGPTLTVTYSLVPEPGTAFLLALGLLPLWRSRGRMKS